MFNRVHSGFLNMSMLAHKQNSPQQQQTPLGVSAEDDSIVSLCQHPGKATSLICYLPTCYQFSTGYRFSNVQSDFLRYQPEIEKNDVRTLGEAMLVLSSGDPQFMTKQSTLVTQMDDTVYKSMSNCDLLSQNSSCLESLCKQYGKAALLLPTQCMEYVQTTRKSEKKEQFDEFSCLRMVIPELEGIMLDTISETPQYIQKQFITHIHRMLVLLENLFEGHGVDGFQFDSLVLGISKKQTLTCDAERVALFTQMRECYDKIKDASTPQEVSLHTMFRVQHGKVPKYTAVAVKSIYKSKLDNQPQFKEVFFDPSMVLATLLMHLAGRIFRAVLRCTMVKDTTTYQSKQRGPWRDALSLPELVSQVVPSKDQILPVLQDKQTHQSFLNVFMALYIGMHQNTGKPVSCLLASLFHPRSSYTFYTGNKGTDIHAVVTKTMFTRSMCMHVFTESGSEESMLTQIIHKLGVLHTFPKSVVYTEMDKTFLLNAVKPYLKDMELEDVLNCLLRCLLAVRSIQTDKMRDRVFQTLLLPLRALYGEDIMPSVQLLCAAFEHQIQYAFLNDKALELVRHAKKGPDTAARHKEWYYDIALDTSVPFLESSTLVNFLLEDCLRPSSAEAITLPGESF